MSKQKRCPHCGETDITKFGIDRSRKDGLTLYCRACNTRKHREDTAKHRDKRNAYFRDYRRTHPKPKQPKPKACPMCGETRLEMFGKNRRAKDGLTVYCRTCSSARNKSWYDAHKDIVSTRRKARRNSQ